MADSFGCWVSGCPGAVTVIFPGFVNDFDIDAEEDEFCGSMLELVREELVKSIEPAARELVKEDEKDLGGSVSFLAEAVTVTTRGVVGISDLGRVVVVGSGNCALEVPECVTVKLLG